MGGGTSHNARSRSSRREVVGSSSGGGGGYYLEYNRSTGSPRRYGVHRATATRGAAAAVLKGEDDEVELTRAERGCRNRDRDRYSSSNLSSLHGGVGPGGILVNTEVRVSSDEGPL